MPNITAAAARRLRPLVLAGCALLAPEAAFATVFDLPEDGAGLFGQVEHVRTTYEDTLIELARRYSLGYEELLRVNPGVDPWLPGADRDVVIPGQRVLPPGPREGIVVNIPEHRLYYFPKPKRDEKARVMTFPVSVGKMDWRTPLGVTRVVNKRKNPSWYPPPSVRKEHEERGDPLPAVVGPGPDNPLGAYAMRLGIPGGNYLIHGTNNPDAVGMAVTHGCLRMYPEDVEQLFNAVPVGTPVALVNEPVKISRVSGEIWLEVHPPVDAEGQQIEPDLPDFERRLDELLGPTQAAIHWDLALAALRRADGVPQVVGLELLEEEPATAPPEAAPADATTTGAGAAAASTPASPAPSPSGATTSAVPAAEPTPASAPPTAH
ncbi:MAG: L,D-transpeptidase family protein [Steroidobacteraceae bacterium]